MAVVGYARVSTVDQTLDAQVEALRAAGAGQVFTDVASGKTVDRPGLRRALAELHEGDTFLVCALDRFGRSLADLVTQLNALDERGVMFKSLREAWDTTTPSGRLLFQVSAAFAEFERALIVDRTKVSLEAVRRSGKKVGRPRLTTPERARAAHALREQGLTTRRIAATLHVSQATVIRCLDLWFELPEASELAPLGESA